MTDPDGTLARIDADLEAWELGPDAYRWSDEAEAGAGEPRGLPMPGDWVEIHVQGTSLRVWRCLAEYVHVAARSGVGNSSGDQESTHTVEDAQNGAQSPPGPSQPNHNPPEAP